MEINVPYLGKIEMDKYVITCTSIHSSYSKFWKNYKRKYGFDVGKIDSLDTLLNELPIFPSSVLQKINPLDLIPSIYWHKNLVESVSSGTTGKPKKVYWHKDEIELMIKFATHCLTLQNFPRGEKWIGTETPNKVLKKFLRGTAKKLDGRFKGIEVDEKIVNAVKRAAEKGNIREMAKAYLPVIDKIGKSIEQGTTVYEDATLGLLLGGEVLGKYGLNQKIKGVLFGGVATSPENVHRLKEIYPNSKISGWYGNHFSGAAMYRPREGITLHYQSVFPLVIFTVRKKSDLREIVNYNERGVVVATKVSKYSLCSLELGDEATRTRPIQPFNWDAISDVTRLERSQMKEIEKQLYSRFLS